MKYRIKKVTYKNGTSSFFPQRRHWLYTSMVWENFKNIKGYDCEETVKFVNEEQCKLFLSGYVTAENQYTIDKIEYKPYP